MVTQAKTCETYGSPFDPPGEDERLGIAIGTLSRLPLNALRHPAEAGTCGWYVWGGELDETRPDFFQTLCVHHSPEHAPELLRISH
jgi:hypothetical protein